MTRNYTPEAVAALVKAARGVIGAIIMDGSYDAEHDALIEALRPFTTEPSSWKAHCDELWGEKWGYGDRPFKNPEIRAVSYKEVDAAKAAYRARYGVEP